MDYDISTYNAKHLIRKTADELTKKMEILYIFQAWKDSGKTTYQKNAANFEIKRLHIEPLKNSLGICIRTD